MSARVVDLAVGQEWHSTSNGHHYHLEIVHLDVEDGEHAVTYQWLDRDCEPTAQHPRWLDTHKRVTDQINEDLWLTLGDWTLVTYVIEELPV